MHRFSQRTIVFFGFLFQFLILLSPGASFAGVGESAVITLSFPPGARATGTGEAFTGLSDDATATYFNPAGLGLSPMANSWKVYLLDSKKSFTAIVAAPKKDFAARPNIWAGTGSGVLRFNGKLWESCDYYLVDPNDQLDNIAEKFIEIADGDKIALSDAVWSIRTENGIGMKRYAAIQKKLLHEIKTFTPKANADSIAAALSRKLVEFPASERISTTTYTTINGAVDSARINNLSSDIDTILASEDKEFADITELKIPFTIAVRDSVTAMTIDKSDRLWVGTSKGLWRFSENKWSHFSVTDGLPSNTITALAAGPYGEVAIGTDNGVGLYANGEWVNKTDSTVSVKTKYINAVAFGQNDVIYAGTDSGLIKFQDNKVQNYDTTDGLLTRKVTALFMDSGKKLWIGGPNSVTVFNNASWKRFQFPNSKITSFAEQNERTTWIGTDKGAISHTTGKTITDERGNVIEQPPEWRPYHSKNAMTGDNVAGITVYDKDIWLITERCINQYDVADRQTSIAFEMLLPEFKINDLWHLYWTLIWPTQEWGTIGGFINYINMGANETYDELGRQGKTVRSWEGVFGLSYGMALSENASIGLNAKFVVSALAPGMDKNGSGVGTTFAIDASILKRKFFLDRLDLGFMMQNMGPGIFYIDESNKDPIPFTLRFGSAYHLVQTPINELTLLFDMHKEIVKNNYDGDPDQFYEAIWTDLINDEDERLKYELQEINYNLGLEYWYAAFLALRTGFLFDYLGERYEWTVGIGVRYGTLNVDWSYIYAPLGFLKGVLSSISEGKDGATGARDGQWRASFIFVF